MKQLFELINYGHATVKSKTMPTVTGLVIIPKKASAYYNTNAVTFDLINANYSYLSFLCLYYMYTKFHEKLTRDNRINSWKVYQFVVFVA